GLLETRRLPGSGAGPSPDRLFIGSEGILGVITEAWMRLQDRPRFRAGGAVQFAEFFSAARAVRAIAQAGLYPANCRILDPQEAYNTGAGDGKSAILVLAFESGDHPAGHRAGGAGDLPVHPCRPRWPRALFLLPRLGAARRSAVAMADDQKRRQRGADHGGRDDHASSRGRPRPPPVV